ncbi:MAG: AAA family ATPase [Hyphomicrobiaceae bacterium]
MKIRAIRVAELGRFREPVALEGLSGGLDLVIGPNEAGKSTLFRALNLALFEKHRSKQSELEELRPYSGGAPLVEAEIEVAGEAWRVRKRFLAERSAEVVSLATGAVSRGSDAEDLLERLLGEKGADGRFPLLWLKQGALLVPADPGKAGETVLRAAVDREVSSAVGGEVARRVRDRVRAALEELVSAKRGQARGRYLEASRNKQRAESELDAARALHQEAEGMLDRLAELEAEQARIAKAGGSAAMRKRLGEAEERLKAAQRDVAERESARAALADARAALQAASAEERRLLDGLAELERLEAADLAQQGRSDEVSLQLEVVETEICAAEGRLEVARRGHEAAEAALKRSEDLARWVDLDDRVRRARGAADRVRSAQERLAMLAVDDLAVKEARRLAARVGESSARLEATSTAVTIRYDAGSDRRISLSGRRLADGERIVALEPLVLEIPGIGRVTVEPGGSGDRRGLQERVMEDRAALADILARAGVDDLTALERRHEAAQDAAAALGAARAELGGLTPEGLPRLEEHLARLQAELGALPERHSAFEDARQLSEELTQKRSVLQSAEEDSRRARLVREGLLRECAVLATRREERSRRRSEIDGTLPAPEMRPLKQAEVAAAVREATRKLDETVRLHALAASRAPDDDGLKELEESVATLREAVGRAEQQAATVASDRARVEGALEAVRRDNVDARLAELEAQFEEAESGLNDVVEEVRALQILDAELTREDARLRENYLAPVLFRLRPYLQMVFPDADLGLGGSYGAETLKRGVWEENVKNLSGGTREQIAVLVRLAFARLLADQGMAVPLVLDDVLVYSDDQRIAAMQTALEEAGRAHQVIVLSCRERAFATLRGNRVGLVPWRPNETAAAQA